MMKKTFFKNFLLLLVAVTCINMGGGTTDTTSDVPEPYYTKLENGEKIYVATITENGKGKRVKSINFAGKTSIKVKREGEELTRAIDLETTSKLTNMGLSKDQKFVLATQEKTDGTIVTNLLVPKNIIVSGIGIDPEIKNDEVFGRFHIFKEIIVDHAQTQEEQVKRITGR